MSISTRRLLLLSSSALVALCFAGAASSQTPPTPSDTPPTTTPPALEAPASQGPQAAPEAPQAAPQTEPSVSIPTVTVTAPPPRPRVRTARPAAPARVTTPPPPPPTPTPTPTATPSATTAGQPAATSPFNQPPASLNTITSSQIQASPAQSFGNLFLHASRRHVGRSRTGGVAPGPARARRFPRPRAGERHRLDGRLRSRPGPRYADRSALDPEDRDLPRAGGTALRLAGGRRRGRSHQQPHSVRRTGGRLASPVAGRHDYGRPRSRGRRLVRCRHPRFRDACRLLRPSCQRLFRAELPLSFPDRSRAVV